MSDRRRVDGNRAMKRGFSGCYVKASLRRALRQPVAPWPSTPPIPAPAPDQAQETPAQKQEPT